jgi:hypothetical protein
MKIKFQQGEYYFIDEDDGSRFTLLRFNEYKINPYTTNYCIFDVFHPEQGEWFIGNAKFSPLTTTYQNTYPISQMPSKRTFIRRMFMDMMND